jgi:hypothetical protein
MWFYLPDSINVLAKQDPRLVYDLLLSLWATLKSFGKAKEIQTGMIAFCTLGTEPVPAPALTLHRTGRRG